jgi:hypothetical protein
MEDSITIKTLYMALLLLEANARKVKETTVEKVLET